MSMLDLKASRMLMVPLSITATQYQDVFTIDGRAVSWSSKKQPIVALSTTEAEYIAATHAVKEAIWIHMFLTEITRPLAHPTMLYCDNQSAISISKNDQYHACTKHINICHHFIHNVAARRLQPFRVHRAEFES
jgi:hypothetical protein